MEPFKQHQYSIGTEPDLWNRKEDPEISPHCSSHLILDKAIKDCLSKKSCWKNWISTYRTLQLGSYLSLHSKIKSKWIRLFHVRPESLKLLEKNIEETLQDVDISNYFLNRTLITQEDNSGNWQMGLHQTQKLLHSKGNNEHTTWTLGENFC
jgi:hypothetical protein